MQEKEKTFEKKSELIDAAINEFSERGYENASLNNILKQAGISKGTFYYHFKNKEALYIYLIGILIDEKKEFLKNNVSYDVFSKDIFTIFEELTKAGMKFANKSPSISKFSESFIKEKENEIYKKVFEKYNFQNDDYMNALIENAYSKGEFREDLPKEFIKSIVSYLFTNITNITSVSKMNDYEEVINNLIKFMKNGLSR
ncbi:TetR/AcrR family transcriptional regulator [Alkalithermobacter paradoxus]|uniref:HTH-type transcriptional regulator MtrR n=1 Tax=Alkalithermobacter paradoxus TaxID=29349 RepID=A0A1V4I6G5_9FIRM|nr:HTH-type transcriptional regulator MtrR [[Clostridium] thermoalcaliphilum]